MYLNFLKYLTLFIIVIPFVLYTVFNISPGLNTLTVNSGSMEPAIHTGSVIYIHSVSDYSSLSKGDIITFQDGDYLTTHRIHDVQGNGETYTFITKGDANEDPDPNPIEEDRIVGKTIFSIPYLGYILSYAGTFQGLMILVLIPAFLLIANEFEKIFHEYSINNKDNLRELSIVSGIITLFIVLSGIFGYASISETPGISSVDVLTGFIILLVVAMLALNHKASFQAGTREF
ncbi:MAG: signal peptidase I [Candidatus Nanohaloarchaea archaeon]